MKCNLKDYCWNAKTGIDVGHSSDKGTVNGFFMPQDLAERIINTLLGFESLCETGCVEMSSEDETLDEARDILKEMTK